MSVKEFLQQEAVNVKILLEETLRYKYGPNLSEEFFTECSLRLNYLISELDAVSSVDTDNLQILGYQLNNLSGLIARIERSSIENFSWPFAVELQRISKKICSDSHLLGESIDETTPPIIRVFSGGGLSSYAIYPEEDRAYASKNRILTIVFPRTLKHYVLLHSILGHEIGHAIWKTSRHKPILRKIMDECLYATGCNLSNINSRPTGYSVKIHHKN